MTEAIGPSDVLDLARQIDESLSPSEAVLAESVSDLRSRLEPPISFGWIGQVPDLRNHDWREFGAADGEQFGCVYVDATRSLLDAELARSLIDSILVDGALVVRGTVDSFGPTVSAILDGSAGAVVLEYFRTGEGTGGDETIGVFALGLRVLRRFARRDVTC